MVPRSLIKIKSGSSRERKRVIARYDAVTAEPEAADYLLEKDIIKSHIQRSREELTAGAPAPRMGRLSFTRARAGGCAFSPEGGVLTEISVGAMGQVLSVRGDLQVAAGFFSSMVASIDDYLDREGSFDVFGERLFYISHAYRDLVDLALEMEAERGNITRGELLGIKERLFEVISTLVASETASTAEDYLYKKSCGDKVIGVLFPSSDAGEGLKNDCREIGRLVGEAGQLIDDMVDYDYDKAAGKRNFIIMTGRDLSEALALVDSRLKRVGELAGRVNSAAVDWILDVLSRITRIFANELKNGGRVTNALLRRPLNPLIPRIPQNQFFLWF